VKQATPVPYGGNPATGLDSPITNYQLPISKF
jgi:hypothetical protein